MPLPKPEVRLAGHDQPQDETEGFRSALKDVAAFCRVMSAHCNSVEDLAQMAELAITNRGLLNLLMNTFQGK